MEESSITALNIIERIFSNWKALEEIVVVGRVHDFGIMEKVRCFCQSFAHILTMEDQLDYKEICIDLVDITNMIFNKLLTDNSEKEIARQIMLFHEFKLQNDTESVRKEFQKLPVLRNWIKS